MSKNRLITMYEWLSPRERLPLLLAAEKHGDLLEEQRLTASAPAVLVRVHDYWRRSMTWHVLTLIYITEQLEHIANYWHAAWRLTDSADEHPEDWQLIADINAYVFCREAEAWQQFCDEEQMDAGHLVASNYLGWILQYCATHMPDAAPSRDALAAELRSHGRDDPAPVTTEQRRQAWRRLFDRMVEGEGNGNRDRASSR